MNKVMSAFKGFVIDENAVTAIEYSLMAAVLAAGIIVAVGLLSEGLVTVFTSLGTLVSGNFS